MGFFSERNGDLKESTVIGLGIGVLILGGLTLWGLSQAANDPSFHLVPVLPGYQPTPTPAPTPGITPPIEGLLLFGSGIGMHRALRPRR